MTVKRADLRFFLLIDSTPPASTRTASPWSSRRSSSDRRRPRSPPCARQGGRPPGPALRRPQGRAPGKRLLVRRVSLATFAFHERRLLPSRFAGLSRFLADSLADLGCQ